MTEPATVLGAGAVIKSGFTAWLADHALGLAGMTGTVVTAVWVWACSKIRIFDNRLSICERLLHEGSMTLCTKNEMRVALEAVTTRLEGNINKNCADIIAHTNTRIDDLYRVMPKRGDD